MKNQFVVGDTSCFSTELINQDNVTLIGWNDMNKQQYLAMLMAASEAKQKDGIVHINARLLQNILNETIMSIPEVKRGIIAENIVNVPHNTYPNLCNVGQTAEK